jgi:hypothetical protein
MPKVVITDKCVEAPACLAVWVLQREDTHIKELRTCLRDNRSATGSARPITISMSVGIIDCKAIAQGDQKDLRLKTTIATVMMNS